MIFIPHGEWLITKYRSFDQSHYFYPKNYVTGDHYVKFTRRAYEEIHQFLILAVGEEIPAIEFGLI